MCGVRVVKKPWPQSAIQASKRMEAHDACIKKAVNASGLAGTHTSPHSTGS
jgi:hypothetical protein